MGTHPIFESDFDCLTECSPVLLPVALPFLPHVQIIQHGNSTTATSRTANGMKWNLNMVVPKKFGSQTIRNQQLWLKSNSITPRRLKPTATRRIAKLIQKLFIHEL